MPKTSPEVAELALQNIVQLAKYAAQSDVTKERLKSSQKILEIFIQENSSSGGPANKASSGQ